MGDKWRRAKDPYPSSQPSLSPSFASSCVVKEPQQRPYLGNQKSRQRCSAAFCSPSFRGWVSSWDSCSTWDNFHCSVRWRLWHYFSPHCFHSPCRWRQKLLELIVSVIGGLLLEGLVTSFKTGSVLGQDRPHNESVHQAFGHCLLHVLRSNTAWLLSLTPQYLQCHPQVHQMLSVILRVSSSAEQEWMGDWEH